MLKTLILLLTINLLASNYPKIELNQKNLKKIIKELTTSKVKRNHENLKSLNKTAEFIKSEFKKHNLELQEQNFLVNKKTYKNIIGVLNKDKKKRIIIGAHYDVYGEFPGADDNASGVAALIELARIMKKYHKNSEYRFDFVAYSLEEPPFFGTEDMGSYIHAKSLKDKNIDVRAVIVLDMIGYFSDEKNSQDYPLDLMKLTYPSVGNFIAVVANTNYRVLVKEVKSHISKANIKVESLVAPAFLKGVDFSDHRNYWKFGYDAIMITDTAFYRNPNYHTKNDTINTLNFDKMSEVIKGIIYTLINIK